MGCSGTDSELSGQIAPPEKNGKPYIEQTLGIIKEGTGTYTLTNNNNLITGGIQVLGGKLLVNNDVKKTESEGLCLKVQLSVVQEILPMMSTYMDASNRVATVSVH